MIYRTFKKKDKDNNDKKCHGFSIELVALKDERCKSQSIIFNISTCYDGLEQEFILSIYRDGYYCTFENAVKRRQGIASYFKPNGVLYSTQVLSNCVPHGCRTIYDEYGRIMELWNFENGNLNGYSYFFDERTELVKFEDYRDNYLNGTSLHFDANGNTIEKYVYTMGILDEIVLVNDSGEEIKSPTEVEPRVRVIADPPAEERVEPNEQVN